MKQVTIEKLVDVFKKAAHLQPSKQQFAESMPKRTCLPYIPPPTQLNNSNVSKYIERVRLINTDIEWCLKLNNETFIQQIQTNQTIKNLIQTYLTTFPNVYLFKHELAALGDDMDDVCYVNSILKRYIYFLIVRIHALDKTTKHQLLNSTVSIDGLLDLCVLYDDNRIIDSIIDTFIGNYKNKKFTDDFKVYIENAIQNKFAYVPPVPDDRNAQVPSALNVAYFNSLIQISFKLKSFLKLKKSIWSTCMVDFHFEHGLIDFILKLFEFEKLTALSSEVLFKLKHTKYELISLFNQLFEICILFNRQTNDYIENLYQSCIYIIDNPYFMEYYMENFNINSFADLIFKAFKDKQNDTVYKHLLDLFKTITNRKDDVATGSSTSSVSGGACAAPVTEHIDHLQELKTMFPEYDETFLRRCLVHFNYDTNRCIDALLDNRIPESLLLEVEDKHTGSRQQSFDELNKRKNVFDGDEFDVWSNDAIDRSRLHVGKKEVNVNLNVIDEDLKAQTLYSTAVQHIDREYEDEYDDTYDEYMGNVDDNEGMTIKPLNEKLTYKKSDMFYEDEEEQEDEAEEQYGRGASAIATPYKQQYKQRGDSVQSQQYSGDGWNRQQPQPQRQQPQPQRQQQQQGQRYPQDRPQAQGRTDGDVRYKQQANPQPQRQQQQPQSQRQQQPQQQRYNQEQQLPQRLRHHQHMEDPDQQQQLPEGQQPDAIPKDDDAIKRDRRYKNINKAKSQNHNRRDLAARKQNRGLF